MTGRMFSFLALFICVVGLAIAATWFIPWQP